jgi:ABC-type phosphate transport system substrate-binding protein
MRMISKVFVGVAVAAMLATSVGVAMADPMNAKNPWKHGAGKLYYPGDYNSVTPRDCDVVGSGSNTIAYLMDQYSLDYNTALLKAHKKFSQKTSCKKDPTPFFYSWDALQNAALAAGSNLVPKPGCASLPRPNGSSAGIAALADNETVKGHKSEFCWDYARSSRAKKSTDPTDTTFIPLALDNVTYATLKDSNAPKNLTTADLTEIYNCTVTNWDAFPGGKAGTIAPYLPQPGSGTLAFFEAAIGVTSPGPCVTQPASLEENEGIDPIYSQANAADIIVPFSAGKWIAQAYHSPACSRKTCLTDKSGVFIKCNNPKKGQNDFGCDVNGNLVLNDINGTSPTMGSGSKTVLNPKFTSAFVRALYAVVRGTNSIPKYLMPFFGKASKKDPNSICSKTYQHSIIPDYGFEPNPACGTPGAF